MALEPVLPVGSVFADYVIESVLARGGMGVVYRATQQQPRRRVALKLITPERAADPAYRDRFLRETDSLASLEHPNIVPIHAAGEWQGQLYLAMRLVDGSDLGALIAREGPMAPGRALSLVSPVADALEAAHAEGLVHRDVKPANILVDSRGAVYLTDFGLTKRSISETGPTLPGQAIGSPGYMSPEQFTTGISPDPTIAARTDQYALACVLYACLTGQEPYHRDTWEAAMWAHVFAPIPRLSERRPDLPAGLDAVMETALAKDPAGRFESVTAFIDAFREVLPPADRKPPVVATPPPAAAAMVAAAVSTAASPDPAPVPAAPAIPEAPAERRRVADVLAPPPPPRAAGSIAPPPPSGDETIIAPVAAPAGPPAPRVPGSGGPGWGGPASAGAGGQPPRRPGRLSDGQLLGIGGVAVALLLVVVVALSGVLGGNPPGPTASPRATTASYGPLPSVVIATFPPASTPDAATPTPEVAGPTPDVVTPRPDAATPPPEAAADYERLVAMIPAGVRGTCEWISLTGLASAFCTQGNNTLFYTIYADLASMNADYATTRDFYKIPAAKGDCAVDDIGESTWHYGEGPDEGRLMCSKSIPSAPPLIGWTQDAQLVYGEIRGTSVRSLYDVWASGAVLVK